MLKILQARCQQYVNMNFQMFKLDLEKAEQPETKWPTSVGSLKRQGNTRITSISALLITPVFGCVDHSKLWKILKEMGILGHLACLLRICRQVRKQQLELDMEQQTGSKSGKEYIKVYCHPAYLTYMQSTS